MTRIRMIELVQRWQTLPDAACVAEAGVEAPATARYRFQGASIRSPARIQALMRELGSEGWTGERFMAFGLDGKHKLALTWCVSVGTLTTSLVHPREVFGPAVAAVCGAVVVAHNHPSGDPEPSVEDVEVTRRLVEAGRLLGVPLLDHVVCGAGKHVSLRERMGF